MHRGRVRWELLSAIYAYRGARLVGYDVIANRITVLTTRPGAWGLHANYVSVVPWFPPWRDQQESIASWRSNNRVPRRSCEIYRARFWIRSRPALQDISGFSWKLVIRYEWLSTWSEAGGAIGHVDRSDAIA